ncbi:MAG: tripartite tricarboxylate transporter substrate binding protein, partial [Burkholderiaceae bacterium]|nr:tripartite tricarboxylate transporter substrate binding protein [Burkholderiaceae bacterium]
RPIRFLNPFQAGSNGDVAPRLVLQRTAETIGQQFIIESHPGGSAMLALRMLAAAKPDGYTLGLGTPGNMVIGFLTMRDPGYEADQLEPITLICETPLVLSVTNSLPVNNVQELIAWGRANPGKLNYAYDGIGSSTHLAAELLLQMTGVTAQGVSYKGGAGGYTNDFVAGRIHFAIGGIGVPLGLHRSGQLRIIGVCGDRRVPAIAQIPTVAEQGLAGFDAGSWFGIFAPRGMPRSAFNKLGAELRQAVEHKDVASRLSAGGFLPLTSSSDALKEKMDREKIKWAAVATKANITKS